MELHRAREAAKLAARPAQAEPSVASKIVWTMINLRKNDLP
jgi:hypothetical protein